MQFFIPQYGTVQLLLRFIDIGSAVFSGIFLDGSSLQKHRKGNLG